MNAAHPAEDHLIAYSLGELEAEDRRRVDSHLESCGACRSVVVALAGAMEAVKRADPPEAPAHVLVDLLQEQGATRARARRLPWHSRPIGATAAAIVLAGIFMGGFLAGRQTSPAPVLLASAADTLGVIHLPLPEPPEIPFQTAMSD
jgi:anti-sigma factor RsiW